MDGRASLAFRRRQELHHDFLAAAQRFPHLRSIAARDVSKKYSCFLDPLNDDEVIEWTDELLELANRDFHVAWNRLFSTFLPPCALGEKSFFRLPFELFFEEGTWHTAFFSTRRLQDETNYYEAWNVLDGLVSRVFADDLPPEAFVFREFRKGRPLILPWLEIVYHFTEPMVHTPFLHGFAGYAGDVRAVVDPTRESPFRITSLPSSLFDVSSRVLEKLFESQSSTPRLKYPEDDRESGSASHEELRNGRTREENDSVPPAPSLLTELSSKLLAFYTDSVFDEGIKQVLEIVPDSELTVDEKLKKIDRAMPIPPSVSAEKIAKMLGGVTGSAVKKTDWWKKNRKGRKELVVQQRREQYQQRSE